MTAPLKGTRMSDGIQEKALAAAALSDGAGTASAAIDRFAGWLLTGFGAGVALLLTNRDVQSWIPTSTVRTCLIAFAWSVVLVVAEKFVSIAITGSAESGRVGRELSDKAFERLRAAGVDRPQLDPHIIVDEVKRALLWPGYRLLSGTFSKVLAGDLAAWARVLTRMAQVQGMLVLLQWVLFLVSRWRIASALSVAGKCP